LASPRAWTELEHAGKPNQLDQLAKVVARSVKRHVAATAPGGKREASERVHGDPVGVDPSHIDHQFIAGGAAQARAGAHIETREVRSGEGSPDLEHRPRRLHRDVDRMFKRKSSVSAHTER
jgi:hypothetical protein